jgi:hypothetical protein
MARNGVGVYSLPQAPYVAGTVISSTSVNSNLSDIANALTQSIASDGQTTPTANLPMGGYRHTNVANATARDNYAAMGQIQDGAGIWCGTAGGTANALTLTPAPSIPAYAAGQVFRFTAGASPNTGAATMVISGLTAQAIQASGAALTGGEIAAGRQYSILYDGAAFQIQAFAPSIPAPGSIANGQLANMAANTVKVRAANTSGVPSDLALSASQLLGRGSTGDVAALSVSNGVRINGTTLEAALNCVIDRAYASYTTATTLSTAIPIDDTIPQNTEGTQILSASITPKTTTNRIRARFQGFLVGSAGAGGTAAAALFVNSGANALATSAAAHDGGNLRAIILEHEFVPGSTSAQTLAIRVGGNATILMNSTNGSSRAFGGVAAATLVLEEIVA